jgi:hypothetical protein
MSTFGRKYFTNYALAIILILVFVETKVSAKEYATQEEYNRAEAEAMSYQDAHPDGASLQEFYDQSSVAASNPPSFQQPTTSSAPVGSAANPSTEDPFSTPAAYDPSDVDNPANPDSPYYSGPSNNTSPVGTASNPSTEDPFKSSTAYDPNDLADPNNPDSPYYSGDNAGGASPSSTTASSPANGTTGAGGPVDDPAGTKAQMDEIASKCKTNAAKAAIKKLSDTIVTNATGAGANAAPTSVSSSGVNSGGVSSSTVVAGANAALTTNATQSATTATNSETAKKEVYGSAKQNIYNEAFASAPGFTPAEKQANAIKITNYDIGLVNQAGDKMGMQDIGKLNADVAMQGSQQSIKDYGNAISGSSGSGLTGAGGTGSSLAGGSTGSSLAGGTKAPASNGGFFSTTTGKVVGAVAAGGLVYGVVSAMQDDDDDNSSSGNSGNSGSSSNTCSHGTGTSSKCTACNDGYKLSDNKCVKI